MTFIDLTVFSMNLRFGLADDGSNGWPHRKRIVKQLLNHYSADFYSFQEVNDFQADDLQVILAKYGMTGQRRPAPAYWQNNLIFYHPDWCCTESHHFYLSNTPDVPSKFDDSKWPRQCTMGLFTKAGQGLVCINTHFDFKPGVQEKSARLILSRLNQMPNTLPVIITGDFNSTPDDRCFQIFTGALPEAEKSKSVKIDSPVFKSAFKPPYPSTHHGFTGNAQGGLIDWVLYRGEIEPKGVKIVEDTIDGRYPSDHFPLLAHFGYRFDCQ